MGGSPPRRGAGSAPDADGADSEDSMIVAMSERGRIDHDDRGQAQWKWATETLAPADPNDETFDYLKAIDAELELEQTSRGTAMEQSDPAGGYNPYEKPK